jgi:uncharacterized membrane protein
LNTLLSLAAAVEAAVVLVAAVRVDFAPAQV